LAQTRKTSSFLPILRQKYLIKDKTIRKRIPLFPVKEGLQLGSAPFPGTQHDMASVAERFLRVAEPFLRVAEPFLRVAERFLRVAEPFLRVAE
jgi:hypothetical protein